MSGNLQVRVVSRPEGIPQPENFEIVDGHRPIAGPGGLLIRNLFLSVEPAMRGWLADQSNYSAQVELGSVMRALAVGRVESSNDPGFTQGDLVMGWFGWQEWSAVGCESVIRTVRETDLSPSLALGVLGINGVTALLALEKIGQPKPGETVLVTAAAGSVGSAVGQIAKLHGCHTVGLAGGSEKVDICRDVFGFDEAIDYRKTGLEEAIARACPNGIDIYFDNVAGVISDTAMRHLAVGARVIVCGTAAIQHWDPMPTGPRVERHILTRRARMEGFVIFDHMAEFDISVSRLTAWLRNGELRYREEILDGINHCPGAIAGLYAGANFGKRLIRLS
jgi:NADPH-dependent curcumin reductase CurA